MNATTTVRLEELTPCLVCKLCQGYLVDAATIIECQHSFCKACIVKHLKNSEYCPVCDVQLHASTPLNSVRLDHMLQEIVYKLVPGLFEREMKRRREFYQTIPQYHPSGQMDSGMTQNCCYISSMDEIQVSLELDTEMDHLRETTKRYLQCKAGVSISALKKFICGKYEVPTSATLDVMYGDRDLPDDFLLMDIAYKYSWNHKSESQLPLKFRVKGDPKLFESAVAGLKPVTSDRMLSVAQNLKKLKKNIKSLNAHNRKECVAPEVAQKVDKAVKAALKSEALMNGHVKLGKPMKPKLPRPTINGVTPHLPPCKKGRPRKIDLPLPHPVPAIRSDSDQREVRLAISEKGVISAIDPNSGEEKIINYSGVNGDMHFPPQAHLPSKENGSAFPQIDPFSIFPGPKPKKKPKKVKSLDTPNGVLQAKVNDGIKRKIHKTKDSQTPVQKLTQTKLPAAFSAMQKNNVGSGTKPPLSRNMETLKGVTRKIQEEPPEHYFAAELLPLNSPCSTSSKASLFNGSSCLTSQKGPGPVPQSKLPIANGPRPSGSLPKAGIKRPHTSPMINGNVKFTPSSAKKLISSPKSKLPQTEESPSKKPKFFKSRQQQTPTDPPTPAKSFPSYALSEDQLKSCHEPYKSCGKKSVHTVIPSLSPESGEELPDIDPLPPPTLSLPSSQQNSPGPSSKNVAAPGLSPSGTSSRHHSVSVTKSLPVPHIPLNSYVPFLSPQFAQYMNPMHGTPSIQHLIQAGFLCSPEIMQSFQAIQNAPVSNAMNALDFSRFYANYAVPVTSAPSQSQSHPGNDLGAKPARVPNSPKVKKAKMSEPSASAGKGSPKPKNAKAPLSLSAKPIGSQSCNGSQPSMVNKDLARLSELSMGPANGSAFASAAAKARRKSSSPSKLGRRLLAPKPAVPATTVQTPPSPVPKSQTVLQPIQDNSSETDQLSAMKQILDAVGKSPVKLSELECTESNQQNISTNVVLPTEIASEKEGVTNDVDADVETVVPEVPEPSVTSTTEATKEQAEGEPAPESRGEMPNDALEEPKDAEPVAENTKLEDHQLEGGLSIEEKQDVPEEREDHVTSTNDSFLNDDCEDALTIVLDKEESNSIQNDENVEEEPLNSNNNEVEINGVSIKERGTLVVPSPVKTPITNGITPQQTESSEIPSTATSA